MRIARALFVVTVFALALAACGGRTVSVGPAPTCPAPLQVVDGASCSAPSQTCAGAVQNVDCGGNPTGPEQCTCAAGTWSCAKDTPPCPSPPPAQCPSPAAVTNGASCSSAGASCPSSVAIVGCNGTSEGHVYCSCAGVWSCSEPSPPDCVDAAPPPPACPDPTLVGPGGACTGSQVDCPGNPQPCGSATFYDVFDCSGGAWMRIVATACDVDGGVPDGGEGD